MSVALDAKTSLGKTSGANSLALNFTVSAGLTNSAITVALDTGAGSVPTTTSVQWDATGTPASLTKQTNRAADPNCSSEHWGLLAPVAGTKQVKITMPTSVEITGGAASWQFVNQSTTAGFRNTGDVGTNGGSGNPSVATATNPGDVILFSGFDNENASDDALVPTVGTLIHMEQIGAGKHSGISAYFPATLTGHTVGFTGVTTGNVAQVLASSIQWDGVGDSSPVVTTAPRPLQLIPMRPGPGGFRRASPFRFDSSRPATSGSNADSTQALPFGMSASGAVLIQAASSNALAIAATESGSVLVQAASSSALPIGASADGSVLVQGASSAALPIAGAEAGVVLVQGASSQPIPFGGSAAGAVGAAPGSAAPSQLVIPMRPTAGGLVIGKPFRFDTSQPAPFVVTVTGNASSALPFGSTANATVLIQGASSKPLPFAASEAGVVTVQGASSLPIPFGISATGVIGNVATGDSSRALPIGSAATGTVNVQAQASSAIVFGMNASASVPVAGASSQFLPFGVSAAAGVLVSAGSSRAIAFSGIASGTVGDRPPTVLGLHPTSVSFRGTHTTVRTRER